MSNESTSTSAPSLSAEACAWLAQLETGALSAEDLNAFREWIRRSPRHYAEIRRLAELAGEINVLTDMAPALREAAKGQRAIVRKKRFGIALDLRIAVLSAVVFATIVIGLAGLLRSNFSTWTDSPYLAATMVGQSQELNLVDGTVVTLNTDSQIEVNFDQNERRVRLLKGEAFFKVAHNSERPFVVHARDKNVTAVGTAFAVRWTNDDLVVTVSEGKVAFESAPMISEHSGTGEPMLPDVPQTLITAGQRLALAPAEASPVVDEISERELARELSWRQGILDFAKAPLGDVVREMERYTTTRFEIVDDELRDIKFGGIFRIGETEAFFEALELSFGVEVVQISNTHVLLQRANPKNSEKK